MDLKIDFEKPYLNKENIFDVDETSIMNFYSKSSTIDRLNLFFILVSTYEKYTDLDKFKKSYLCYLISYYTHVYLTPPGEYIISISFAKKACEINPNNNYIDWLNYITNTTN